MISLNKAIYLIKGRNKQAAKEKQSRFPFLFDPGIHITVVWKQMIVVDPT